MNGFVIRGIDPAPFGVLYGLGAVALADAGVIRMRADVSPGFPCRVTLADVAPDEDVLLLNYEHLPVRTPYSSRHAIFIREGADTAACFEDVVPAVLAVRLLSIRAFDAAGMMTDADVVDGATLRARSPGCSTIPPWHICTRTMPGAAVSPRGSIAADRVVGTRGVGRAKVRARGR